MKRISTFHIFLCLLLVSCSQQNQFLEFESDSFKISITQRGIIKSFVDKNSGNDYLAKNISTPLLSIRIQKEMVFPLSANLDEKDQIILLSFPDNINAKIKVESKETHLTFELKDISDSENIELIVWGPYPTTIKKIIGETIGSKIALFGCSVEKTLDTIGAIEIAEDLPHPQIDGQWGKAATSAAAAYIILDFSEKDIEEALAITKKAGLRYLYHGDPFETWGHFKLKEKYFPNEIESVKRCVEKAESMGIKVGIHTLSNFITTNDSYVTPIPDKRLAKIGSSFITRDIDSKQLEILIKTPDFFNQFKRNFLKTVVIGNELIRYSGVSDEPPWTLLECQRGAFGTTASSHKLGEKISKLADHGYNVFLTNSDLSITVAKNIAELFNKTGLRQISFDGLEGNHSTGMGNYGEVLFTKTWYDFLSEEIKQHYIADASRSGHFFWHIYTRMNWGEPWYAGFRESQTEYRLRNQKYFQRNFMPGMLGWFKMTSETSIEDIEWMLARSAAFDAGYAFVANYESIKANGHSEEILKLLSEWEKARMSKVFNEKQKQLMQDINNEFHLKTLDEKEWELFQVYSYKFKHEKKVKQPGEPLSSTFSFENPAEKQPMNFIFTSVGGTIQDFTFEVDNFKKIELPVTLQPGQTIKYTGSDRAIIYNKNWKIINEIKIDVDAFTLSQGKHLLSFDCKFKQSKEAMVKLELRFIGKAENVS